MSEPVQPPVPPSGHDLPVTPAAPPAAPLPAAPQYPTAAQGYPSTPPYPAVAPGPQGYPMAASAAPAPRRESNPLARAAFIIAVATFAINLFGSIARPFVYSGDGGYEFMLAFDNGIGILSFFLYVVALILGLIAVRRAGSRLLTGMAIGIAAVGAIGFLFTSIAFTLLRFF
ncbi:hypothetical protein [Microbacterium paraoxydans]|uniref:hypothetical protein n=1 Tax=Microbacterium paraoxydans TaxID=199592 RepID=UPI001CF934C1|nr:hypothetical protein [Microbacterium paraoxydans]